MKKLLKRGVPLVMAFFILCGSIFSSYTKVQATGITDILYYTYWDLISTIYAQCGYSTTVDQEVLNNHGVTGKQVWDNFCTAVEGTAKFHGKLFKGAMSEMYDLAKNATQKGISMSQDLYDMLKDCLCDTSNISDSNFVNSFDASTRKSVFNVIVSSTGCSNYDNVDDILDSSVVSLVVSSGHVLNIIYDPLSKGYYVFATGKNDLLRIQDFDGHNAGVQVCDNKTGKYSTLYIKGIRVYQASRSVSDSSYVSFYTGAYWIMKSGSFFYDKTISAKQVSEGACPQEVPETIPWRKEKSIPDGWRVVPQEVPGTGGDQEPDKDPKEDPDILPAVIPLHPLTPDTPNTEKPDSTEEPGQKPDSTENPDKDPDTDPDKKNDPGILINPSTGYYIDPNTGFDIDPKTGKLIDPETGELIEPDLPDSGGGSGGGGGIMDKLANFGDITKLFPFCIPFDLVKLIKGMRAEEAPPVFHYEHYFESIDYTFVVDVDLSDYEKYIKLFRYGMQLGYIVTLMFLTIRISALFT